MARTGRPLIGDEPRNARISLRATKTVQNQLRTYSKILDKPQGQIIEELIGELYRKLTEA